MCQGIYNKTEICWVASDHDLFAVSIYYGQSQLCILKAPEGVLNISLRNIW